MKRRFASPLLILGMVLLAAPQAHAQRKSSVDTKFLRTNPKFVATFREVVAKPSLSTVRVVCDGKDTALGMIVGADGWILTKANDLHGDVVCRLKDGREFSAEIIGTHRDHDLAMLKIEAEGLKPIEFTPSKEVDAGSWVACAGLNDDPVAIGVVSVGTRSLLVKGSTFTIDATKAAYLGVGFEDSEHGVRITQVDPKTPAATYGVKAKDIVRSVDGKGVMDREEFLVEIGRRKPGDIVVLKVLRSEKELDLKVTLGKRPQNMARSDTQNNMGSELSSRRSGYATILQHDSVVKPVDCGGPIVDLDGRVIGINICRAGRTESWAVPSEVVLSVLAELKSGKLAPEALADAAKTKAEERKRLAAAAVERAKTIDVLLGLMKRRLELSIDVARYKFANKLPVADEKREEVQLARLLQMADDIGLDKNLTREFLTAQFAASRKLQESLHEQWSKDDKAPNTADVPDLKTALRPKIDDVSRDLIQAFAKAQPHLRETSVQQLLRQRSASILQGEALSESVRERALAGWLASK